METSNGLNFFHIANQGKTHVINVLVGPTESSTCLTMEEDWVFPIDERGMGSGFKKASIPREEDKWRERWQTKRCMECASII